MSTTQGGRFKSWLCYIKLSLAKVAQNLQISFEELRNLNAKKNEKNASIIIRSPQNLPLKFHYSSQNEAINLKGGGKEKKNYWGICLG